MFFIYKSLKPKNILKRSETKRGFGILGFGSLIQNPKQKKQRREERERERERTAAADKYKIRQDATPECVELELRKER